MTVDLPVLPRTVIDGNRQVTFNAAVLAAATTWRPGHPRWTEMTIYRLPKRTEEPPIGGYVVAKVGRSQVMHTAACPKARPNRMARWTQAAADEQHRVPCLTCNPQPTVLDSTATWLERDRHSVLQARTAKDLALVVLVQVTAASVRGMTAEIVYQLRQADPDFDRYWVDEIEPTLMEDV